MSLSPHDTTGAPKSTMTVRPRTASTASPMQPFRGEGSGVVESDAPITEAVSSINKINRLLKQNPIGLDRERLYVPEEELNMLLDLDTIRGALDPIGDNDLAQYILDNARKTFATLHVVFEYPPEFRIRAMQTFMRTSFTDETLSSETFVMCESNCEAVKNNCQHYFPDSGFWSPTSFNNFAHLRWQFLVPSFDKDVFRYSFHHQQMLPWRGRFTSTVISSGNFSEVSCWNMIARHQNLLPVRSGGTVVVAHKTLKPMDEIPNYNIEQEWIREAKAHDELNERSEHLIRGIGAYKLVNKDTKHNTYHLILEWADGGNLLSYWKSNPEPQLDGNIDRSRRRVRALLKQFRGLTEALECMHFGEPPSRRSSIQDLEMLVPQSPPQDSDARSSMPIFDLKVTGEEGSTLQQYPEPTRPTTPKVNSIRLTVPDPEPGHLTRTGSFTENWRHGDIKPENILRFKTHDSTTDPSDNGIQMLIDRSQGGNGGQTADSFQGLDNQRSTVDQQSTYEHQDDVGQQTTSESTEDPQLGILKLADLGRARQHLLRTEWRMTTEKERFRTRWYEPPDLSQDLNQVSQGKISRLFDMWSLGCVMLDGILWMFYGNNAIESFQNETPTNSDSIKATPYWIRTGSSRYKVTDAASSWMDHALQDGLKYSDAIADLVKLVKYRLLRVDLPPDSEVYTPGFRTNARDLREQLDDILRRADMDEAYLFRGVHEYNAQPPVHGEAREGQSTTHQPSSLQVPSSARPSTKDPSTAHRRQPTSQATRIALEMVYTDDIKDEWQYLDDHIFAEKWIDQNGTPDADDLCAYCSNIDLASEDLVVTRSNIEENQDTCMLCELLDKSLERARLGDQAEVRLTKVLDTFVAQDSGGNELKILRLCCANDSDSKTHRLPVGAPSLCEPARVASAIDPFMQLPRAWLEDCDRNHNSTCAPIRDRSQLPLRLIDVKNNRAKIVDSTDLDDTETIRYIAFSHKWGAMPDEAKTTKSNLTSRRKYIPKREIPTSFNDAIAVTKALGCKYLWIDCICINQGPDGDFAEQASSMQTVFSNAYCVIAAASAQGATSGFWARDIEENPLFSVRKGEIFISVVTNDFTRDVLKSPLNQRGWVLQEHALARRTIFFTGTQMYWECGDGIRCETLRKLRHDVAGLLGDADFPSKTVQMQSTRGTQIHLWRGLFQQYSSLGFSYPEDRSVAIEGLMARLTKAFKTRSRYGVFESFWGRCLLWRRPDDGASLKRILPGEHTKELPPTWSWMAFEGAIDFLRPEGGEVEWNTGVILPFGNDTETTKANGTKNSLLLPNAQYQRSATVITNSTARGNAIQAIAYKLAASVEHLDECDIHFDGETQWAEGQVRAVIICTSKDQDEHHVLLVSPATQGPKPMSFERAGVACLPNVCIDRTSGINVAIV